MDKTKPESVVNLTGNWNLVFWLSIAFLAVGLTGLWSLTTATGARHRPIPQRGRVCHQFGDCACMRHVQGVRI